MFHSVIGPRPQANPAGLVSAQYFINYFYPKTIFVNGQNIIKLELAKYYKDSDMTAYISERSRNSKGLKKYDPP